MLDNMNVPVKSAVTSARRQQPVQVVLKRHLKVLKGGFQSNGSSNEVKEYVD